jgi:hypothetical protein
MGKLKAVKLGLRQSCFHFHCRRPHYKLSHQSSLTWDISSFRNWSSIAILPHLCARAVCRNPAVRDKCGHSIGKWRICLQQGQIHLMPLRTYTSIYCRPFHVLEYRWLYGFLFDIAPYLQCDHAVKNSVIQLRALNTELIVTNWISCGTVQVEQPKLVPFRVPWVCDRTLNFKSK